MVEKGSLAENLVQQINELEEKRKKLLREFTRVGIFSKIRVVLGGDEYNPEFGEWGRPLMMSSDKFIDITHYRFENLNPLVVKVVIRYTTSGQLIILGRDVKFSGFILSDPTDGQNKEIMTSLAKAFEDPYMLDPKAI